MDERLNVFIAELDSQWNEILKLHLLVEKKIGFLKNNSTNEELIDSIAYKLHNIYSAYEDIFKLITRFFENNIDEMGSYHIDLLKRMLIEIKGIRPFILSQDSLKILDELRGFRHVFRHAYSYAIDAERLIMLAEKTIKLKEIFQIDFDGFKNKLINEW